MQVKGTYHEHTIDCYARNATGPLAYTLCRADGLDRNLLNLKPIDFHPNQKGLRLVCPYLPLMEMEVQS